MPFTLHVRYPLGDPSAWHDHAQLDCIRISVEVGVVIRELKRRVSAKLSIPASRLRFYGISECEKTRSRFDTEQIFLQRDDDELVSHKLIELRMFDRIEELWTIGAVVLPPAAQQGGGNAHSQRDDADVKIAQVVSAERAHEERTAPGRANAVKIDNNSESDEDGGGAPRPKRCRHARKEARAGVKNESSSGSSIAGGTARDRADCEDGDPKPIRNDVTGSGAAGDDNEITQAEEPNEVGSQGKGGASIAASDPAAGKVNQTASERLTIRQWLRSTDDKDGNRLEREYGAAFQKNFSSLRGLRRAVISKHVGVDRILRECSVTVLEDVAILGDAMDEL